MTDPKPNFGASASPPRNKVMSAQAYPSPRVDESLAAIGELSSWAVNGSSYSAVAATTRALPAGFYECQFDHRLGPTFRQMTVKTDQILRLPDKATEVLMKEFVTFWSGMEKFAERGLSCKRGLLLWGPPGSGKTSAIQSMAQHMIEEMDGIVVMAGQPELTTQCLVMLRQVEPDRPLIVLYEDIDALVDRYGESDFLSILDGEHQIANVINVATTNYPERLDKRFADRPGRFDRVQYVGMPTEEARRVYLQAKGDLSRAEIEHFVSASAGWSIAHLRELIVGVNVLGEEAEDVILRLSKMRDGDANSTSSPEKTKLGFAA